MLGETDRIILPFHWNGLIIFLSFMVGLLGSYTTTYTLYKLERSTERKQRIIWLIISCVAFGGCSIFSLHLCGMMALDLGVSISYDPLITFISFVLAVVGDILAFATKYRNLFQVVNAPDVESAEDIPLLESTRGEGHEENAPIIKSLKPDRYMILGGFFLALSILMMHYTNMYGMKMDYVEMSLSVSWVILSFIPAWVFSALSLNMLPRVLNFKKQLLFAFTATLSVFLLHYIGMYAATFITDPEHYPPPEKPAQSPALPLLVVTIVVVCCFVALTVAAQSISQERDDLIGAIRDKRYIDALKAEKDALERESREKTEFIAIASHELRTPLHGISGFCELLAQSDLDEEQQENLKMARQSIKILESVVDNVLNFTRLVNRSILPEEHWNSIPDVIYQVLMNLSVTIVNPISVIFHNENEHKTYENCDMNLITQVVQNLVSNAYKFTISGSVVVRFKIENGMCLITVQDTGIGISEEQLRTIFQPFTQVDKSLSRNHTGTGMGLAICHHIVTLLKGEITVESVLGQGSTFTVKLPMECQIDGPLYDVKIPASFETLPDDIGNKAVTEFFVKIGMLDDHFASNAQWHVRWVTNHEGYSLTVETKDRNYQAKFKRPINLYHIYEGLRQLVDHGIFSFRGNVVKDVEVSASTAASASKPYPEENGKKIVLVAEDNHVNQVLIKKQLTKIGYKADFANNGQEAVEMMREKEHMYICILMDIQMPIMDGFEASRAIRKFSNIPIVALTANVSDVSRTESERSGMTGFLSKPVNIDQLKIALSTLETSKS